MKNTLIAISIILLLSVSAASVVHGVVTETSKWFDKNPLKEEPLLGGGGPVPPREETLKQEKRLAAEAALRRAELAQIAAEKLKESARKKQDEEARRRQAEEKVEKRLTAEAALRGAENDLRDAQKGMRDAQNALAEAKTDEEKQIAEQWLKDQTRLAQIAAEKLKEAEKAYYSTITLFLRGLTEYYRQYSGMAGWSSLIWDEEFLQEWRDTVNEIMCDTLHLPTKECWTSQICGMYSEITPTRDGVLFSSPQGGAPRALAHIEGERSLPIVTPNATSWIYTVTYSLTNPSEEDEMSYNVHFGGPTRTARWWTGTPPRVEKGGTVRAVGASALQKLSIHEYTQVCLQFDPEIRSFDGREVDKICNDITQYTEGATMPYLPTNVSAAIAVEETPAVAAGGSV